MNLAERTSPLDSAAESYFLYRDQDSLSNVVAAASGLIHYFARLYGKGCERDDIRQAGMLGLMKALNSYDSSKGASFVTYASHFIMGEIRHLVRKNASYYRPGCIVELQSKVDRVVEEYVKVHGDVPPVGYIAEQLNIREQSVQEVMRAGLVSFDDLDATLISSSSYESFRLPIEDKITLYQAVRTLTSLQQRVINMLFFQGLSQEQVAKKLGLTQRKVSRIKSNCLSALQEYLQI